MLDSAGIPHRIVTSPAEWTLVVVDDDAARAEAVLTAYDHEAERPREPVPARELETVYGGMVIAVLLLAFYAVTSRDGRWSDAGVAVADRILDGELWRTVTALTLHADAAHALGNAVACAMFVTAVFRLLGPGLGGWLVLLAGAGGNFLNALLHGSRHRSVGASTAIFGAIGILGGLQFMRKQGERRAWLALGGSLALLAMLGTSERSDLGAHLCGLGVGVVLGIVTGAAVRRPLPRPLQWALVVGAIGAIAVSWTVALGS